MVCQCILSSFLLSCECSGRVTFFCLSMCVRVQANYLNGAASSQKAKNFEKIGFLKLTFKVYNSFCTNLLIISLHGSIFLSDNNKINPINQFLSYLELFFQMFLQLILFLLLAIGYRLSQHPEQVESLCFLNSRKLHVR